MPEHAGWNDQRNAALKVLSCLWHAAGLRFNVKLAEREMIGAQTTVVARRQEEENPFATVEVWRADDDFVASADAAAVFLQRDHRTRYIAAEHLFDGDTHQREDVAVVRFDGVNVLHGADDRGDGSGGELFDWHRDERRRVCGAGRNDRQHHQRAGGSPHHDGVSVWVTTG